MSYYSRLYKAYEGALRLPLNNCSKYVIISDCHRGIGNVNDNFIKNQNLYYAALSHYFRSGFTYIELGDGDELWENRSMKQIIEAHDNVFRLLSLFYKQNRLYLLYGNHDIIKKDSRYIAKSCNAYPHSCIHYPDLQCKPLLPDIKFHEGIILENIASANSNIFLTHGHQASLLNSTLWPLARFLVRYLWKPLEHLGVPDPTSAAKNNTAKEKTEQRLQRFAKQENLILIAGHTHRPTLSESDSHYYNSGSGIHPYCITCLEIEHMYIRLVKWVLATRPDMTLYVTRKVIGGPRSLS